MNGKLKRNVNYIVAFAIRFREKTRPVLITFYATILNLNLKKL